VQGPRRALSLLGNRLETGRLVLYGLGIGALVGFAGTAFTVAVEFLQNTLLGGITGLLPPGLPNEGGVLHAFSGERSWLLPILMALALAAMIWLERIGSRTIFGRLPEAPIQARGDGLDSSLNAYHNQGARVNAREVTARTVAGALSIAGGLPLGREGPLSSLATGIGVVFGSVAQLSEADRRLVFVAAMAAGLGIVLRAPLAGAVLAVEILYRRFEFEIEALTPAVLSSVVAFAIYGAFRGFGPLFDLPVLAGQPPQLLPAFFVLGLLEAAAAVGFVAAFKGLTRAWTFTKIPVIFRLVIAGLLVGLIGLLNPGVLGDGLGWAQLAMSGFLPISSMLALMLWRAFAVLFVGSVGSPGGLIVPSLGLGALIGNLYALGLGALGIVLEPAAFTLTGMAAFLAGTFNVPLAATLLVTEWSGYGLLIPLLLTTIAGYALTGREGLYEHQAESRSSSPAHIAEYLRDAVRLATGSSATQPSTEVATLASSDPQIATNLEPRSNPDLRVTNASNMDLLDLLSGESLAVSDDDLERLYRMNVPESWLGRAVRDLDWPNGSLLVAILRSGHVRVPRGNTMLEPRDELIVMAEPEVFSSLNPSLNSGRPEAMVEG
jgi:chloride channel protein, CIC family